MEKKFGEVARSLFGNAPASVTKKPQERVAEQQPIETKHEDAGTSSEDDWREYMRTQPSKIQKESLFKITDSMAYAAAARQYAIDHPDDTLAEQRARETEERARPRKGRPKKTDGSKGAYFIVDATQLDKIQQIARDNGLQVKQVMQKALSMFIESYESRHGEVIPRNNNIDEL